MPFWQSPVSRKQSRARGAIINRREKRQLIVRSSKRSSNSLYLLRVRLKNPTVVLCLYGQRMRQKQGFVWFMVINRDDVCCALCTVLYRYCLLMYQTISIFIVIVLPQTKTADIYYIVKILTHLVIYETVPAMKREG